MEERIELLIESIEENLAKLTSTTELLTRAETATGESVKTANVLIKEFDTAITAIRKLVKEDFATEYNRLAVLTRQLIAEISKIQFNERFQLIEEKIVAKNFDDKFHEVLTALEKENLNGKFNELHATINHKNFDDNFKEVLQSIHDKNFDGKFKELKLKINDKNFDDKFRALTTAISRKNFDADFTTLKNEIRNKNFDEEFKELKLAIDRNNQQIKNEVEQAKELLSELSQMHRRDIRHLKIMMYGLLVGAGLFGLIVMYSMFKNGFVGF